MNQRQLEAAQAYAAAAKYPTTVAVTDKGVAVTVTGPEGEGPSGPISPTYGRMVMDDQIVRMVTDLIDEGVATFDAAAHEA